MGGTGQIGGLLRRHCLEAGDDVCVVSRGPARLEPGVEHRTWDGKSPGSWVDALDGADTVINLAGRSVSCRYTEANKRQMLDSRVDSTRAVGEAIARVSRPPRVWLQMSTATIYADRRNGSHDEDTGILGGAEPGVPDYWAFSVRIAKEWEAAQAAADSPNTRRVALRAAMVMTPDQGGVFDALSMVARTGLGGAVAGGSQMVSWIHGHDFVEAVRFLVDHDDIHGPVNLAAPHPLPQAEFMAVLRRAWGRRIGLPATALMAGLGARVLDTDPELLLKSRSVIPGRLVEAGFRFRFPWWAEAAPDLVAQTRRRPEGLSLPTTFKAVRAA